MQDYTDFIYFIANYSISAYSNINIKQFLSIPHPLQQQRPRDNLIYFLSFVSSPTLLLHHTDR